MESTKNTDSVNAKEREHIHRKPTMQMQWLLFQKNYTSGRIARFQKPAFKQSTDYTNIINTQTRMSSKTFGTDIIIIKKKKEMNISRNDTRCQKQQLLQMGLVCSIPALLSQSTDYLHVINTKDQNKRRPEASCEETVIGI